MISFNRDTSTKNFRRRFETEGGNRKFVKKAINEDHKVAKPKKVFLNKVTTTGIFVHLSKAFSFKYFFESFVRCMFKFSYHYFSKGKQQQKYIRNG